MGTRRRAGLPYFDPGRYWCKARYRYRLPYLSTALYLTAEPGTGSGCSEVGVGRTLEGRYLTVNACPRSHCAEKKNGLEQEGWTFS